MNYNYPDKNDALTANLIDSEFEDVYWMKSEDKVIEEAINAIKNLPERNGKKKLLDLGCGMGRLIPVFAPYVNSITAVEPDHNRYVEAVLSGNESSIKHDMDIEVINGDIDAISSNEKFDVILSSHVLQHISRDMAIEIMEKMSERLEEGGLLIITTTYTDKAQDCFFKESWDNGKRQSIPITCDQFDDVFSRGDELPVRMFSRNTIESLTSNKNLTLSTCLCYHFKGHNSPKQDADANNQGNTEAARDIMYIFKKQETLIDANIAYRYNFSISGVSSDISSQRRNFKQLIKDKFGNAVFLDDDNYCSDPVLRDLSICQGFLHGDGLPFECQRAIIRDYKLSFEGFDVIDSGVLISFFPETLTCQLSVNLSIRNTSIDSLIYMRHVQSNGAKMRNKDGRLLSATEIYHEISSVFKTGAEDLEKTYYVEIKKIGEETNADAVIEKYPKALYGIMCGDEGWRHVPAELAAERLTNCWGSREFVKLVSFGSNNMLLNLNTSLVAKAYVENRRTFDNKFYGDINEYFLIDSSFAGINHGIIFSLELVMVIKTICNRILRQQSKLHMNEGKGIQQSINIKEARLFRAELLTTLHKVENLALTELGEMEKVLLTSHQINPIVDKIKYLLELIESELDLLYQNSTNRLINILTVTGLVLSFVSVASQIYSLIC